MERLCLFSHNRFHNLRNIHIMIVLLRIELVSASLSIKSAGFMDVRYILRQMRMVSASSKCRYAVDEDRGQAGFLDFVVVTARYGAAEFESIAVSVF